jgi:hypothetical protein
MWNTSNFLSEHDLYTHLDSVHCSFPYQDDTVSYKSFIHEDDCQTIPNSTIVDTIKEISLVQAFNYIVTILFRKRDKQKKRKY